jgi:hypothetical protein
MGTNKGIYQDYYNTLLFEEIKSDRGGGIKIITKREKK